MQQIIIYTITNLLGVLLALGAAYIAGLIFPFLAIPVFILEVVS